MKRKYELKTIFKKISVQILTLGMIAGSLNGCNIKKNQTFQAEFFDLFDTHTIIIAEATSQKEFRKQVQLIYDELLRLHKLYDSYNAYEGIHNIYTINHSKDWVEVDKDIIELLTFSKEGFFITKNKVDPSFGPVIEVWQEAYNSAHNQSPYLPSDEALREANQHVNIDNILIKDTKVKVKAGTTIHVGAIAKGVALEKLRKILTDFSGIINVGGDILALGTPSTKDFWQIGIKDPFQVQEELLDIVEIKNKAVVTSGNYERFFVYKNERYHHIIDTKSLYPSNIFASVTVVHENTAMADLLSTGLFLLSYEEGLKVLETYGGEALWVTVDGTKMMTDGYRQFSKEFSIDHYTVFLGGFYD